jgi:hypothetical protein
MRLFSVVLNVCDQYRTMVWAQDEKDIYEKAVHLYKESFAEPDYQVSGYGELVYVNQLSSYQQMSLYALRCRYDKRQWSEADFKVFTASKLADVSDGIDKLPEYGRIFKE